MNIRSFIAILCMMHPFTVFSNSNNLIASLNVGYSYPLNKPHSPLSISNYVSDSLVGNHKHDHATFNMNLKNKVLLTDFPFINSIAIGPSIYYQKNQHSGNVWELQLPEFDNYHYNLIDNNIISLLEGNFYFRSCASCVSPFFIAGIGFDSSSVKYNEHAKAFIPKDSELHLHSKRNNHFAYSLGFGLSESINEHWLASISYTYLNANKVHTSKSKKVRLQNPIALETASNNIYVGVSYLLE